MITIYAKSWNANAAAGEYNAKACDTLDAEDAAMALINLGFAVRLLDLYCENANVGCECDSDAEYAAIANL